MNTKSNIITGVIATIALVIGVIAFNKTPDRIVGQVGAQGPAGQTVVGPKGDKGDQGAPGRDGKDAVATRVLGSATSPDISSPYLQWGGVYTYQGAAALKTATTTPCAIQAPSASSTLVFATFKITTGTSTDATTWTIATSTTAFSTTTGAVLLNTYPLAAGATGEFASLPVPTGGKMTSPILPNAWVVFGVAGTIPGGSSTLLGTCSAGFRVI